VGPEQVVFVGASRTAFDVDLETFQAELGGPLPLQLATVGSNPLIILENLAEDSSYAGTTIVGIVPGLAAAGGGPPLEFPKRYVDHWKTWSPGQRMELPLALWLQDRLAFINEDLPLANIVARALTLPPRADVHAPQLPPYLSHVDHRRQFRMTEKTEKDPEFRARIQQLWLPLFEGPPRPGIFTPEQWEQMQRDGWTSNLARFRAAVAAITGRGGRVIFHRPPSSGAVYQLEQERTPRADFWDRLLREASAPGVSFDDEPTLQGFDCPEWSHLSASDAVEYTRRFAKILRTRGLVDDQR
jgi:hypothetical protein